VAIAITGSAHPSSERSPEVHGYEDELARLDAVATIALLDRGDLSVAEITGGYDQGSGALSADLDGGS